MGPMFDEMMREAIAEWDVRTVVEMDFGFRHEAAEDAVSSLSFLMGALDGLTAKPRVLSYEGPFGVGYLVAAIDIERAAKPSAALARRPASHPLVRLAREAVETFVCHGRIIAPTELPGEMLERAAGALSPSRRGASCAAASAPSRQARRTWRWRWCTTPSTRRRATPAFCP